MLQRTLCEKARLSRDARFDGKFYTAVLTTGIFCRPICPARPPKPENVNYYSSAEQAQAAGFRPCKRCIPESAPAVYMPIKLKQLCNNFNLNQDSISSLSIRLGVSERQLQRIFKNTYGIAPLQFFQQQRLLLARKLLITTELSITDVCFASGFNSIRRFNEAIKAAYHCTPSELKSTAHRCKNVKNIVIELSYRPPFDWPLMLKFFQDRQISTMEHIDHTYYQRTVAINECKGWLKVTHHEHKNALVLTVNLSDYRYLNNIIFRIRRMFDLDADMNLIHQQLSQHPLLQKVIKAHAGLRLPGSWSFFEFSIRAILGQQVSVKAATTFAKRIAEKYGSSCLYHDKLRLTFPTLEQLTQADFEEIGLTTTRKQTLKSWIDFYQKHHELIENCGSSAELGELIKGIKGIGPWTINYLAMRGLSDPDAFPSGDLGVIKALSTNKKLTNKNIIDIAKPWQPWRSYATLYLWHSLH
ncbi:DNA-3-methyladenine glycosylase 2 family protein [Thalassotalea piscium]|uniref:DNA-3-methyladenine glycosylase II n=1 Tax=Thalassotalea piscium TaxID=1230533 RepID=A0A7X0TV88_9GAMM|nr:DNA-3-methyladenine glycosylase 2 [Thalassotalea piscium]MBB6544919.1 AraC family transcriptional regulator of adaptative response / DNA-3-methyladenine glycosylase II [Thalassotalea piscium]